MAAEQERSGYEGIPELVMRGKVRLRFPIKARDQDVSEIRYDFAKVTSKQMLDALKGEPCRDIGEISDAQAFKLFTKATIGLNENIDEYDLMRLMPPDMMSGRRLGRNFFVGAESIALKSIEAIS